MSLFNVPGHFCRRPLHKGTSCLGTTTILQFHNFKSFAIHLFSVITATFSKVLFLLLFIAGFGFFVKKRRRFGFLGALFGGGRRSAFGALVQVFGRRSIIIVVVIIIIVVVVIIIIRAEVGVVLGPFRLRLLLSAIILVVIRQFLFVVLLGIRVIERVGRWAEKLFGHGRSGWTESQKQVLDLLQFAASIWGKNVTALTDQLVCVLVCVWRSTGLSQSTQLNWEDVTPGTLVADE
mmetsp:Transcript_20907/g.57854  ORF Transcript_20907/g.57854 Transcript_20907/m.57854 type:complete len:235 (+) Transcript_20907:3017-3721(+)